MGNEIDPAPVTRKAETDWTVRLAQPEDTHALERLICSSVRALHSKYYSPEQIEAALGTVFGVDQQLIDDGTFFVTESRSEIIGCGGWSKRRAQFGSSAVRINPDPEIDPSREPARIRAFFVHPAWVRRGIGRSILAECERAIRRRQFHRADIVATLPGEPLYVAAGYAVTERFAIPLTPGLTLPVVRLTKSFPSDGGSITELS